MRHLIETLIVLCLAYILLSDAKRQGHDDFALQMATQTGWTDYTKYQGDVLVVIQNGRLYWAEKP